MNICEHLTQTVRIFPKRTALSFEGTEFSYATLNQLSIVAANRLIATGIVPGDRIALMLPNTPEFVVWYYAALRIGAIVVSISTRAAPSEVAFITDDCEGRVLVAETETLLQLEEQLPDCVTTTFDAVGSADGTEASVPRLMEDHDADPQDPALILYTSGTTGFPKGATLSHMNVRSNVHAFNHQCNMRPDDRILLAVPLFHCFGQNAVLNSAFNVGATLVLQRRFDLNEAKRLIADQRVTQLYGVPMMFQLLLGSCEPQDLASVTYCFSAAAPLPVQISERWLQKFDLPIHEGYGLTETSPFASYNHRLTYEIGSIGTPIDCVEMRIVSPETGEDCPPGTLGEIVVRGPNVMLGYWNRPEETAAAIREGWFYSGDIGRQDERGYFYIVDRVKDMISVGGLKVYPAEVERILLDHPDVAQAAVIGVPDQVFGEQVVAFVVTNQPIDDENLQRMQQHARQHLANYKVPRLVVQIDELPRNPSGKVLKTKLRDYNFAAIPQQDSSGNTTAPTSQSQLRPPTLRSALENAYAANRREVATQFVQRLVQMVSDSDDLPDADTRFLDASLDSLMIVEMSNQIQAEIGPAIDVPATLVFDHPRISDLATYLLARLMPKSADNAADEPLQTLPVDGSMVLRNEVQDMSEAQALAELMKEIES